jgi:protein-ribulosamine 3-kinase
MDAKMFTAERAGLEAIRATNTIRAPEPLYVGEFSSGGSFHLMEYIDFTKKYFQPTAYAALGEKLAALHLSSPPDSCLGFGFSIDNTLGTTPQPNTWSADWIKFFLEQRLQHQINLTRDAEILALGQQIYKNIPVLIGTAPSQPSLIHGDLWTGNFAFTAATLEPVVFDPACYWADSEAEFGISHMQGGLGKDFYDAYNKINPPRAGWEIRREIYMLYHNLNHLNLWGAHWRDLCISTMKKILTLPVELDR